MQFAIQARPVLPGRCGQLADKTKQDKPEVAVQVSQLQHTACSEHVPAAKSTRVGLIENPFTTRRVGRWFRVWLTALVRLPCRLVLRQLNATWWRGQHSALPVYFQEDG